METSSLFTKVASSSDFSNSIEVAMKELSKKDGRSKLIYHGHTCRAVSELNKVWFVPRGGPQTALLHALGPGAALEVIGVNLSSSSSKGAEWLEHEAVKLLSDDQLERVLWEQCAPPPGHTPISGLSVQQNMLLKTLTRLPDLVSTRRGRSLNSALYPNVYYRNLANVIDGCLTKVVDSIRNSNDVSIAFLAALVAKCSLIGDRDSFWATLCPLLEEATLDSPLWQRVSQTLVRRVPDQSLESVLTGIMKFVSLSLSSPSPLYRLLGNLPLDKPHAKFLLTQKFTCTRPFDEPRILLGYFNSSNDLRCFITQVLLNSLPLWSDSSVLKHMSVYHHYRLTGIITMATTCYVWEKSDKKVNSELERLSMRGIQAHLDSPVETIRVRGMVLGEHLMARLHPSSGEGLEFTYDSQSEDVKWLKSLMEPLSVQEKHLESQRARNSTVSKDNITPKATSTMTTEPRIQYGVGVARVDSCPDDDSDDDDLQPYDMSNDPDSTHSKSPRYLRTCMQDLLSKDHDKSTIALLSLKDVLNKSSQDDLGEVCVELTRMLLHIDTLVDSVETRMDCFVIVTTKCPKEVAPYLCEEFYSPHYNLRQRMEILDIISKSAVDLSSPPKTERKIEELAPRGLKPWQQIVEDRIKAKTRIISRGPSRPPSQPVQNRFSSVCGLFFFPLMVHYDKRMNTLDLQGRDSFVLGHILNTLGTVLQCAAHTPPLLPMATALLDFCWALKHHSDTCVKRGVLYCLCCVLSASSLFHSELMDTGLNEMLLWAKDVASDDADNDCRQLAGMSLSLHYSHINQQSVT